ncbi:MAG: ATP-binding protein [Fibrobacteres bacterium]|nr:ATP-binding protein [Fibrobacterota bacterium]
MNRIYTSSLENYLRYFPCVVITGSRQCGKTTVLKGLSDEWKRYDLERQSDYEIIAGNPDLFLKSNPDKIAIDESQRLPALFPALRVAIDDDRNKRGRYIITGSSSPDLLRSVSESLAGRAATVEMSPFSLEETGQDFSGQFFECLKLGKHGLDGLRDLKSRRDIFHINRYWLEGGYPETWVKNDKQFHKLWMEEFEKTYIERDISRLFPGMNIDKYRLFVRLLSNLSGSIINYSDVSRALGVSAPTIRDYIRIAEGSFMWRHIPSYEKNAVKRIVKHPKGYIRDTGLLHHFLRIRTMDDLLSHPRMGHSWEGLVIEEIIRGLTSRGISCEYYYYRTGAGAEIDLVLEGDFGILPIEIKYHSATSRHDLRSMIEFIRERDLPIGIVINNADRVEKLNEKIISIPFSAL